MRALLVPIILFVFAWLMSCDQAKKPIDGKTRRTIDSARAEAIRLHRPLVDSLCDEMREELLPVYIDSIRRVREQEIEEKLKDIPH